MADHSSSDESDRWNIDWKFKRSHHTTCTYQQVYNVNPLMGGFSVLGDTLANSIFNVYQFTGQYKIGANDDNVVLTTTSSCSQSTVSFHQALVVFQQKVTPEKRSTRCKQEVIFNENKYTIVISPFEQHQIDVGTMITASNGAISYTTFKLPSKTNQAKIAQALFDYLKILNSPPSLDNIKVKVDKLVIDVSQDTLDGSDRVQVYDKFKSLSINLPSFYIDVSPSTPLGQPIRLPTQPPTMPAGYTFERYMIKKISGEEVQQNNDGYYYITYPGAYQIGYIYNTNGNRIFYGASYNAYIVTIGLVTVNPSPVDIVA